MHYALRIKHYFVPLQPITNIETMFCEHLSAEVILFFILYGITGAVPLIAAIYLLLRRSNAIAPGISRYQEADAAGQPVGAQQLAQRSGFRSYSTFSRAFMQRTGQSVTAWMRDTAG